MEEEVIEDIEALRQRLEEELAEIERKRAELEGIIRKASTDQESIATSSEESQTWKYSIEEILKEVEHYRDNAQGAYTTASDNLRDWENLSDSLEAQESNYIDLVERTRDREAQIEALLPGATSAGLASAFKDRKESFKTPIQVWGVTFVVAMILLMVVAHMDPITMELAEKNTSLSSYLLGRLPFAAPIIWMAIYAGIRHSQALRLEEDYAHKEAISKSFEGYKTQLMAMESDSSSKDGTLNLIDRTLAAIAMHPGRIYSPKHDSISPTSTLLGFLPRRRKDSDSEDVN